VPRATLALAERADEFEEPAWDPDLFGEDVFVLVGIAMLAGVNETALSTPVGAT
jgi:hypothetical protein